MKYVKIRSFTFDGDDLCGGIGKIIVTIGLRDDGKMFYISTTLRADYLAREAEVRESYMKIKQVNCQQSWDALKCGHSPHEAVDLDQYDLHFRIQMELNNAVEIPAYVE